MIRIVGLTALAVTVLMLSGCRFFSGGEPTRTPIPTFTPTPMMAGAESADTAPVTVSEPALVQQVQATSPPPTDTPQPPPTPTTEPTATPTQAPTSTPSPTVTPTPLPTEPPNYPFVLETAQKFPTESLAADVVRIFAYVYAPGEFGLPDYSVRITHNGAQVNTDAVSTGGLPDTTRQRPSPYTRFTNLNELVLVAQGGQWVVQLVDWNGDPAGPPAEFMLTGDELTRELYVRYRRGAELRD